MNSIVKCELHRPATRKNARRAFSKNWPTAPKAIVPGKAPQANIIQISRFFFSKNIWKILFSEISSVSSLFVVVLSLPECILELNQLKYQTVANPLVACLELHVVFTSVPAVMISFLLKGAMTIHNLFLFPFKMRRIYRPHCSCMVLTF